jgi:hypothetical protein
MVQRKMTRSERAYVPIIVTGTAILFGAMVIFGVLWP